MIIEIYLNIQHLETLKICDTIIGHLHLHVSDLNKANHFFIDSLGFQSMFYYSEQAHFISDLNYHHLAFNLWNGKMFQITLMYNRLKSYKLMIQVIVMMP